MTMVNYEKEKARIEALVRRVAKRARVELVFSIEWKPTMRTKAAEAHAMNGRISISPARWQEMSATDRHALVVQCAAHLACARLYRDRKQHRDRNWLALVWRCGALPLPVTNEFAPLLC